MGADWVDFYVSDPRSSPPEYVANYAERLLLLPGTYLCTSLANAYSATWTAPRPAAATRKRHGLRRTDVLAAYFGQPYKLEPAIFAAWMRILRFTADDRRRRRRRNNSPPAPRLWLFRFPIQSFGGDRAEMELRAAVKAAGVDPGRLVFSDLFPKDEEYSHKSLADLFLDTWTFNAHTTASDSLFAGLPFLTVPGETQISRVGSSLAIAAAHNHSRGLHLVARNQDDYVAMAISLLRHPDRLRSLKKLVKEAFKSAGQRGYHASLWDNRAFVNGYEAGLKIIYELKLITAQRSRHGGGGIGTERKGRRVGHHAVVASRFVITVVPQ